MTCAPLGLMGLFPAMVSEILKWKKETVTALQELCTDFRELPSEPAALEAVAPDGQEPPWVEWERHIEENRISRKRAKRKVAAAVRRFVPGDDNRDFIPAMPVVKNLSLIHI